MSEAAAPQVAALLELAKTEALYMLVGPLYPPMCRSISKSVTTVDFHCLPERLSAILEVFADPTQLPRLSSTPLITIDITKSATLDDDSQIVRAAAVDLAIEGLRRRGVKDLEEMEPNLREVLMPYTRTHEGV